ncbi:MAG: rod shape-determining protein MreC [Deltaproteobacteria bacterium]|nr:rod shape-determining protein MreC [Candidatus Tharpellaceae bacterium]
MTTFSKRYQLLLYVLVVFILTSVFFGVKARHQQLFSAAEQGIMALAYPFQKAADLAIDSCNSIIDNYVSLIHVNRENQALKNRIANLERRLIARKESQRQNLQLRKLLNFQKEHQLPAHATIANVIGRDASGFSRLIFIDHGSRDLIKIHDPALTPGGIVGQVIMASPFSAKIMLITDSHSSCDVLVQRTRERGVLQGDNQELCRLSYLMRSADIQIGDTIITSGMDGVYPKGIPVGTIVSVDRGNGSLCQKIAVQPFANLSGLEEIIVSATSGQSSNHVQ